jgi:hypothetical protein
VDDLESPPPVVLSVFKPYTQWILSDMYRIKIVASTVRWVMNPEKVTRVRIVRFQQPAPDAIPSRLGKNPKHYYSCVDMNQKTCSIGRQ